ncbi:MAG TPA: nucleotidyltransferase domain-containing protein [Ktedonobacterales bacterium]|nr:nucleotidyltransferase domain-containing protein [Ktedonobacterales bacterium]
MSDAQTDLHLDEAPDLPQSETIRALAPRLWRDERVVAIWLGGSMANGAADIYSDIDLRVAVPSADLPAWKTADLAALLGAPPLARHFVGLGDNAFLHHLVVANGDILDLLIQNAEVTPEPEPILVLGCRDDSFAERLAASNHTAPSTDAPVSGDAVRELVVAFWVNSHKHRKVLNRNLDLMFPAAVYANWRMLMSLWHIEATGYDTSPYHFSGIHGLSELVHAVEGAYGSEPLAVCGMPTRNREEICAAIERAQEVVAALGRRLADRYGFEYPATLEDVTRRSWRAFRASMDGATPHSSQAGG